MIFVIGDIHGMLDPIKRLIWKIEDKYENNIDELIFIGDYIDYGPNSKEVIDFITSLPYEKTFLAGNHEDLLLQFLHEDLRDKHFSENYWIYDNEGKHTVRSLTGFSAYGVTPEKLLEAMDKKYIDFFENLLYIYEKEIEGQKYLFTHGHADEWRLDEFLPLDKYDKFHKYLLQNDMITYSTPVWQRKECSLYEVEEELKKVRDYVVVHGHTPGITMGEAPEYVKKYQAPYVEAAKIVEAREVELAEYVDDKSEFEFDISKDEIYGVNVDTGIAIGHGLSALGIPVGYDDYSHIDYNTSKYEIIQVKSNTLNKSDYYMRYYKYILKSEI